MGRGLVKGGQKKKGGKEKETALALIWQQPPHRAPKGLPVSSAPSGTAQATSHRPGLEQETTLKLFLPNRPSNYS